MIQATASTFSHSRRAFIKQSSGALLSLMIPVPLANFSNIFNMEPKKHFDIIIIGGSYSGLAASMALGRALRTVLIIDIDDPCNKQTPHSHNFLTQDGKPPAEIARQAKEQVLKYPTVEFVRDLAISALKNEQLFEVQTVSGKNYSASKLVFSTGIKDIMPGIPGFAESWGISVLHCPYCHGFEVRGQKTGILANGDAAYEMSSLISNWTSDLTLYTNGIATLSAKQRQKLSQHSINIIEVEIDHLEHTNGHIRNVVLKDRTTAPVMAIYSRLPFKQHTTIPYDMGCELTNEGYIKIDAAHRTTVHGVYACGDNTTRMRTVANAVSMGTTTGLMVNKELIEESF